MITIWLWNVTKIIRTDSYNNANKTWDSNNTNDWNNAILNPTYYNSFNENMKNKIGEVKWYLGWLENSNEVTGYYYKY